MKQLLVGAVSSLLLVAACQKVTTQTQQDNKQQSATIQNAAPEPKQEVKPTPPPAPPAPPPMHAGSHILVPYKGAMRAPADVTRTKDEALKLATELAAKCKKDPSKLPELAKKYSSCPSAQKGGDLGAWPKGRMVPAFDQAIEKMKVGEVSDPVETPFGFHVIRRNEPPPLFAGAHILIAYKGAMRARPNVTRTKEEALKLAKELAEKAKKDPSKFAELARENSDGPSGPRGGDLGRWPKGQMVPAFDQAIGKLKVGEVSDPVETPFGFHVMMRKDPDAK